MTSSSQPLILSSYEEIGGQEGFVIAPFAVSDDTPIVLIPSASVEQIELGQSNVTDSLGHTNTTEEEVADSYAKAFRSYHDAVASGRFHKLVLARKRRMATACDTPLAQFEAACRRYPRMMIMLFSTPQSGTWLISSPEVLLESNREGLHTIALAGTMPYAEGYAEWNEKNKAEQHIVEQYIADTIAPLAHSIVKDGPYTMRAGNLQHLRSDFRFQMNGGVGQLIARLHPTPAVCGLPKQEAQRFIIENEGMERRYYSGFAGPVTKDSMHLFVSLRCAELFSDHAVLYAGGGIMPDSQCESEWKETESKMQTIGHVL